MIFLDANLLVYLNAGVREAAAFYESLVANYALCTDVLVLDEAIYVSWRRYGIPFEDTAAFLDDAVLPYVWVLKLGREEYLRARELLGVLRPSDALHVAAMVNNGVRVIASEDRDFDRVGGIERIWISDAKLARG